MSFRVYERLPSHIAARRFHSTTNQLLKELCESDAFVANDDRKPIKYNKHNLMLVGVFAAGGVFWAILLWATMH